MAVGINTVYARGSFISDLVLAYKMASVGDDGAKMIAALNQIRRSRYTDSTKKKALKRIVKWEESRHPELAK